MDKKIIEHLGKKLREAHFISQYEVVDSQLLEREDVEGYLVLLAKEGDKKAIEYIFRKYKALVHSRAKPYFMWGAGKEDVLQEGMIGLHKAIRDFDKGKNILFRYFAELCIDRQIITAVKGSTRQKHVPLNNYVSLYKPMYEDEAEMTLMDTIVNTSFLEPEETVLNREKNEDIKKMMKELLSPLEEKVIVMYLEGVTYQGIADKLGCDIKQIDNALQRAKRKFEKYLMERERKASL